MKNIIVFTKGIKTDSGPCQNIKGRQWIKIYK